MVLVHVHRFHQPTNKQNHPNEITHSTRNLPKRHQPPTRNPPKRNRRGGACVPARMSAQRRFHAKNTRIVRGDLTMDAPLQGDTGGHTGTAPTNLHHICPRIPYKQNNHLHTIHPNDTNRPCAICPNAIQHSHAIRPNETVGAVPACPPERPRSGVSIRK